VRAAGAGAKVLAWPGLAIPVTWHVRAPRAPLRAGTKIGYLRIGLSVPGITLALRTQSELPGPSGFWRATRL
jgi:hypothetical protein